MASVCHGKVGQGGCQSKGSHMTIINNFNQMFRKVRWTEKKEKRKMDCDLDLDIDFDLTTNLSHVFLGCKHQFVVDEPSWSVFYQTTVGMHEHSLMMLDSLVMAARLSQPHRMVEESSSDCLKSHNTYYSQWC